MADGGAAEIGGAAGAGTSSSRAGEAKAGNSLLPGDAIADGPGAVTVPAEVILTVTCDNGSAAEIGSGGDSEAHAGHGIEAKTSRGNAKLDGKRCCMPVADIG